MSGTNEPWPKCGWPYCVCNPPWECAYAKKKQATPADRSDAVSCELTKRITELEEELAVSNKLLAHREQLLNAIPPCPVHGSGCVPHALDWIREQTARQAEQGTGP